MSSTVRLTMAQALVRFLSVHYSVRDGRRQPFFAWWHVAVAEVSEQDGVRDARRRWEAEKKRERSFL